MPATMKDVAALAGVSIKTVSRVVNHEPHTRPEVVRRVEAAVAELGWVANASARALRTGRTGAIGIAVAELRRPYLATLVEAVVTEAERRGLASAVEPTRRDADRVEAVLQARGRLYDGVVLVGPYKGARAPERALADLPVVVVQGGRLPQELDRVDEDVVEAAALVARHLGVMGRSRPVLLGPDRARIGTGDASGPSAALRAALSTAGIEATDVPRVRLEGVADRHAGARAAARALEQHPHLDTLLCVTDEVALGALATLLARGRHVPDDVAVVGYDALQEGRFSTPSLTTVDPGAERMARVAVDLLVSRLDGSAPPGPRAVTTPVELVRRESTMGRE